MRIQFVAGVAPIVNDLAANRTLYADALGIDFGGDEYPMTDDLAGLKHFGLWPLSAVATSCFGAPEWPADLPVPQASIEFDVESEAAVAEAASELTARGYQIIAGPKTEPWGQAVARLLSPDGLLLGVTYTPWMHGEAASE